MHVVRTATPIANRVDRLDWSGIGAGLDDGGVAPAGQVLGARGCRWLVALYDDEARFRSTIDMARHRFGEGQYRYFDHPLPEVVRDLRAAFWPHLLPIAREWAQRRGRPSPWPDDLDDWLDRCHRAGQTRPTPLMLRYGPGDWNALHRDLYGELVFPLQVVVGLDEPDVDYTRRRVRRRRAAAPVPVPRHGHHDPPGARARVHHPRPAGAHPAGLVQQLHAPQRQHGALRAAPHPRPRLPRRRVASPGRDAVSHRGPRGRPRRPA